MKFHVFTMSTTEIYRWARTKRGWQLHKFNRYFDSSVHRSTMIDTIVHDDSNEDIKKRKCLINLMSQIIAGYIKKYSFLFSRTDYSLLHCILWNRFPINQRIVNHFVWLKKCDFKPSESKSSQIQKSLSENFGSK